jgi:hypothetical protein
MLRKECGELRGRLKQEQGIASDALQKLNLTSTSVADTVGDLKKEFKLKEVSLAENNKNAKKSFFILNPIIPYLFKSDSFSLIECIHKLNASR